MSFIEQNRSSTPLAEVVFSGSLTTWNNVPGAWNSNTGTWDDVGRAMYTNQNKNTTNMISQTRNQ